MTEKEQTIGPSMYEQLEEMIKASMDMGWREGYMHKCFVSCDKYGVHFISRDGSIEKDQHMSYDDLFSKDSGIMEFVERESGEKKEGYIYYSDIGGFVNPIYEEWQWQYRLMTMGPMAAYDKVQYFVNNAIIPTIKSE